MSTLKITVGEGRQLDERTSRRIVAAREGEDLDDAQPVLDFDSYDELDRLLSRKNLELLTAIADYDPDSISETADLVGRDYKQVHHNLSELESIGVVEFDEEGPGRPKKPKLPYDGLVIDIPFVDPDATLARP